MIEKEKWEKKNKDCDEEIEKKNTREKKAGRRENGEK